MARFMATAAAAEMRTGDFIILLETMLLRSFFSFYGVNVVLGKDRTQKDTFSRRRDRTVRKHSDHDRSVADCNVSILLEDELLIESMRFVWNGIFSSFGVRFAFVSQPRHASLTVSRTGDMSSLAGRWKVSGMYWF